jgi:membrane-associated phospholipid phosphatase
LTFVMTRVGARLAPQGMQAWDERTLRWVEAHGPLSFGDAIVAESPGNLSYLIPATLAVAVLAALRGRPILALTALASYVLARPIVLLGWHFWDRPRPKLILDGAAALGTHSFPSGHAILGLSVWGLLAYLWIAASRSWIERAIAALLLAAWLVMICVARVRLGAHWPTDTIAGTVIGLAWLAVVVVALRRGERFASHGPAGHVAEQRAGRRSEGA